MKQNHEYEYQKLSYLDGYTRTISFISNSITPYESSFRKINKKQYVGNQLVTNY